MEISKEYRQAIHKRTVVEFVKENGRSPTSMELQQLLIAAHKQYAAIDELGFSGFKLGRPGYSHSSSAEIENQNRLAMADDQEVLRDRLNGLSDIMEGSFRSLLASISKNYKVLSNLESRIDSLLLINGNSDVFLNGIEENFDNHKFVDTDLTDATVADGYVTIGRGGYRIVDLSEASLKYSVVAPQGVLSKRVSTDIQTLAEDDGKFWEYVLYTDYEEGRISVIIEVEFPEETYISDLRLGLSPSSVNKKMTANFFVSTDGKVFAPVGPVETPIEKESYQLNIGLSGIKKLQIILSKDAYDTKSPDKKQSVYTFSIDSLKLYTDPYKNLLSTVVCGPYELVDVSGAAITFTKAKLKACTYEPAGTSIDFYLSNDGEAWVHCSHDSSASDLVLFGSSDVGTAIDYIDGLEAAGTLVESDEAVDALDYATEALLNGFIKADYADSVPLQTVVIKRNTNTDFDTDTILGTERGWSLDPVNKRYTCTVYVDAAEGRTIDFGPRSLLVNGKEVSGAVLLNQGYSIVQVSDINYGLVEAGITDVETLKIKDPLYPHNHKLLLGGYGYPSGFNGDQIYLGLDEFFGTKLKYIAPDYFAFLEPSAKNYYNVFTVEDVDGKLYFKVKVNKTDASWTEELYDMTWNYQSTNSSSLWVKAILTADQKDNSPKLDSYQVQVI